MGKVIRQTIPPAPPERLVDDEATASQDWKKDLPSRLFGIAEPLDEDDDDLTLKQEEALRGYVRWRRLNHALMQAAAAKKKENP